MNQTSNAFRFQLNTPAAIGTLISSLALIYNSIDIFFIGGFISLVCTKTNNISILALIFFVIGLLSRSYSIPFQNLLIFTSLIFLFISVYKVWLKPQKTLFNNIFYFFSIIFSLLVYLKTIEFTFKNKELEAIIIGVNSLLLMISYGIRFIDKQDKNIEDVTKLIIILMLPSQMMVSQLNSFVKPTNRNTVEILMFIFLFSLLYWSLYRLVMNEWKKLKQTFDDAIK